jgi:phage terminase large subunit-like protein
LATIGPDRVGSWGGVLGDMAFEHLGVDLMEWQRLAVDRMLSFDANDDLVHSSSLVSVARQNGKTTIIHGLILWWLVEMPKIRGTRQTIVSTAHRLDLAVMLFEELAPILESKFGAEVMWSYGRNSLTMPDGSRWFVKAAKPSIGHGMSIDLAVVDELFDVSELALDLGLAPAQRARRSPLLAMFSTAGTEASTAMIKRREAALRAIDEQTPTRSLFLEWSPPPHLDPMSDLAFGWGNPALGHTLRPETISAERDGPDRSAYLRASLNLWITVSNGWIPHGRWADLYYGEPVPSGGVVAVEVSLDESRIFAVRAVPLNDGRTVVTIAFIAETHEELWTKIQHLAEDPTIKFAFSPSIDVHCPPALERRRVVVGYGEILKFTPVVRQMIADGRIVHTGETMLAEHVNRAVIVRTQGSVAVSSQKSPGPIELCRTMIWASALATQPKRSGKPALVVVAN